MVLQHRRGRTLTFDFPLRSTSDAKARNHFTFSSLNKSVLLDDEQFSKQPVSVKVQTIFNNYKQNSNFTEPPTINNLSLRFIIKLFYSKCLDNYVKPMSDLCNQFIIYIQKHCGEGRLRLNYHNLATNSARVVAELIKLDKPFTHFHLSHNKLADEGIAVISKAIAT